MRTFLFNQLICEVTIAELYYIAYCVATSELVVPFPVFYALHTAFFTAHVITDS